MMALKFPIKAKEIPHEAFHFGGRNEMWGVRLFRNGEQAARSQYAMQFPDAVSLVRNLAQHCHLLGGLPAGIARPAAELSPDFSSASVLL